MKSFFAVGGVLAVLFVMAFVGGLLIEWFERRGERSVGSGSLPELPSVPLTHPTFGLYDDKVDWDADLAQVRREMGYS